MDNEMLAVVIGEPGGPEVANVQTVPVPALRPGAVRLAVRAAAVGAGDVLFRKGWMQPEGGYPWIPGFDVAGEVVEVGSGVTGVGPGDRVAALLRGGGGNAQDVVVSASRLHRIPKEVSFAQAAAVLSSGLSAMGALHRVGPQAGTVAITAAAGGVGSLLVQLAKQQGAQTVIALAGAEKKCAMAKELGADHAISYSREDWPAKVAEATGNCGVNLVLEAVGGTVFRQCLSILAPGGTLLSYGAASGAWPTLEPADIMALGFGNQSFAGFVLQSYLESGRFDLRSQGERLLTLVATGALRVAVREYALDEVAEAHSALETRSLLGKAVLCLPER